VFIDLERATWKENPGFDAVVGNPPWGAELDNGERRYFAKHFKSATTPSQDSYALFTEIAVRCSSNAGICSFIVPDTFLRKDDLSSLRQHLFLRTTIYELIETGPVFPEARDTWCLIYRLSKGTASETHKIRHRQIDRFAVSVEDRLTLFANEQWSRDTLVPQSHWETRPNMVVGYLSSVEEQSVITSIERVSRCLGRLSGKFSISRGEEGSKYAMQADADGDFWILFPEHMERFSTEQGIPTLSRILTQTKLVDYYTHPKIWTIRIQKLRWVQRLVASWDGRTDSAGMKTLQLIISTTDNNRDLLCLCSLLCSKLMNYWCTNYLVDDLNQSYLEKLPIRRIAFTTPAGERARLVEEGMDLTLPRPAATPSLSASGEGGGRGVGEVPYAAFLDNPLGRWLDERLSPIHTPDPELVRQHNADPLNQDWQLPEEGPVEQSDVVHDLLAHLAQQMIEMNKQKQTEVKGFLSWLEREIGASLDDLTNKTKLLSYLGDYQKGETHLTLDEVLDILRKNRRKLRVDPGQRAFQERLAREYQASLDRLLPLKGRLAATDRLIDLIVYRLYGLTEEDVAIVEGTCA